MRCIVVCFKVKPGNDQTTFLQYSQMSPLPQATIQWKYRLKFDYKFKQLKIWFNNIFTLCYAMVLVSDFASLYAIALGQNQ